MIVRNIDGTFLMIIKKTISNIILNIMKSKLFDFLTLKRVVEN